MLLSSLYLAGTIAEPVRRLAAAADRVRQGRAGRDAIPGFPERNDEIGDLADSLKEMTAALYDRIGAIERFAADVAHELKNPLTSLASAMEMLVRAPDEAARQKLMALVRADVKRIDRLITDISDASRLDAELSREARTEIDLSHLLKTIVEIYDVTDRGKKVAVTLDDELPAGTKVMGHDERLGQVFRNLIDNAISFSRRKAAPSRSRRACIMPSRASRWRTTAPAFPPTIWNPSSSASTPSGRASISARIPASASPSPARSPRTPAAASGPRTGHRARPAKPAAARASWSSCRW